MASENSAVAAIEGRGLILRYSDGTLGSDGVSLTIKRGELLALLGPNGAGKTTLVRQLGVDLKPQAGTLHVFGRDAWGDAAAAKRHFGIIPQHTSLFAGLTVDEHVRCFAPLKGIARGRVAVEAERVVQECGLSDVRRKYVQRLSGGQQRRVLVALALLGDPPILLLDEPTTGLDPIARRELWETIRQKRAEGKTIVLTSHYLDEVEALADRVAFIDAGKLLHVGTQLELAAALPYQARVTEYGHDGRTAATERLFGSLGEAQQFVHERRLVNYAITRTRLEDTYFHLVGKRLEPAAGTSS